MRRLHRWQAPAIPVRQRLHDPGLHGYAVFGYFVMSSGYSCNYTATTPTCQLADGGLYTNQSDCETNCKAAQYAKCNYSTKQCEPCQQVWLYRLPI